MSLAQTVLLAVGLAMDAFAAAVCKGLSLRRLRVRSALEIAAAFGGAQALMPLLGWLLGARLAGGLDAFAHWIAFLLLAFIGGRMIREAVCASAGPPPACCEGVDGKELLLLAMATSIDALAVGISLALIESDIAVAAAVIGAVTFVLCGAGVWLGYRFGARRKGWAGLCGGSILILLGLKLLLQGLGLWPA